MCARWKCIFDGGRLGGKRDVSCCCSLIKKIVHWDAVHGILVTCFHRYFVQKLARFIHKKFTKWHTKILNFRKKETFCKADPAYLQEVEQRGLTWLETRFWPSCFFNYKGFSRLTRKLWRVCVVIWRPSSPMLKALLTTRTATPDDFCFRISKVIRLLFQLPTHECGELKTASRQAGVWRKQQPLSKIYFFSLSFFNFESALYTNDHWRQFGQTSLEANWARRWQQQLR